VRSAPNFEYSVEVYVKGADVRHIVYGRTRSEVLGDTAYLVGLFPGHRGSLDPRGLPADWQDRLVAIERRIPLGLGRQWTRVTRRYDEYGELVR
jgi:hypothetical protein